MKLIFTITIILFSTLLLQAQNLTGVWRGTFEQNNLNPLTGSFVSESYKYEVQINQLEKGALEGVTYSYLTTIFYGKASLKGIINKKNKTLTIKETFLIDVKSTGKTDPCLMTCYLDYSKSGKLETLIGTYSSLNMNTKLDCGSGTVYLEKVDDSDFEKEEFLVQTDKAKKTNLPRKLPLGKNFDNDRKEELLNTLKSQKNNQSQSTVNANSVKPQIKNKIGPHNNLSKKATTNSNKSISSIKKVKPGAQDFTIDNKNKLVKDTISKKIEIDAEQNIAEVIKPKNNTKQIDEVLTVRENRLAYKLTVDSRFVNIEFYDNGEIDNDSISVYKDNILVINKARLSTYPITLNLKFDENNTSYEIITVAENLGDIPPNTALMVINYGRNRHEVFLSSDEKRNAKVIIEYKEK